MIFVGLYPADGPAREEVPAAVQRCADARIRYDYDYRRSIKLLRQQLQKEVNIPGSRVLTGDEISRMDDAEFEEAVDHVNVYARVLPEHKLRIVKALKKK